ncbi:MAG TPA: hypothetical protein VF183_02455, partial [Acidimicrobiales bacterium]
MARDERRLTIVHRVLAVVLVAAAGALVTTRSEAAIPEDALASDGAAVSARDPLLVLGDSLCANSFVETVDIAGVLREVGWEPELVCWPGAPIGFGIDV